MKKTNRYVLIVLVLISAPVLSYSQYFQRLLDCDTSSDFGSNIFVLQDGSYLAFSSSQKSSTNRRESVWANISSDGSYLSGIKRIASGNFSYYQGLNSGEVKQLQDGGYLVPISVARNGKSAVGIMRLDAQADTVFTRFYTDTSIFKEDVASATVMPNGDFVIGGIPRTTGCQSILPSSFAQTIWEI